MTFDPTKPVQTRDGRKARIICVDAAGKRPIAALITCIDTGEEDPEVFFSDGRYCGHDDGESRIDLINVPEEETE